MDLPVVLEMPGGDAFADVTHVFLDGAADMEPGQFLFMDGFDLTDAMSALEIGEARMDSGMILPQEERRPPFDPLTPLLPDEICWILDRMFACEMEWHAGNTLAQTVYTCMFVHHLEDIDPDYFPYEIAGEEDLSRPYSLITFILRAGVLGLLKSCDMAWRELSKCRVLDQEDWQSEKCEISLLEGSPWRHIVSIIEDTSVWLLQSPAITPQWRAALELRLQLRKALLQLLSLTLPEDRSQIDRVLATARTILIRIRAYPIATPPASSPAHAAFDPLVTRRLHSFVPLRPLTLPPQEKTWDALQSLLDGWEEVLRLASVTSASTWETVGYLRRWQPKLACQMPYIRSLTQSVFYDDVLVLLHHPPAWLLDRFVNEALSVDWAPVARALRADGAGDVAEIERRLSGLLVAHVRAIWSNGPRHRRFLTKSLLAWQQAYDLVARAVARLDLANEPIADAVRRLPDVVLSWRLAVVREVVLSGFQLELYSADERPVAYWYACEVIQAHLECLDGLAAVVPEGALSWDENRFQRQFLAALEKMCQGMLVVLLLAQTRRPDWERLGTNFVRRHKWAFSPEYASLQTPMVAPPRFDRFPGACARVLQAVEGGLTPMALFREAGEILEKVSMATVPLGWAHAWTSERINFTRTLKETSISADPDVLERLKDPDLSVLHWDPTNNPWFPSVRLKEEQGTEADAARSCAV